MTITVGYYDMSLGQGSFFQRAPILANDDFIPVNVTNLSEEELSGIDVLFVQNPSNGSYGAEYLNNLDNIENAVADGMTVIIHDRFVTPAEQILPSGSNFDIIRDFSDDRNINVLNPDSELIVGPGGIITDTNLDGGNSSSHGFAVKGTLPGDADLALSRSDPSEIVTFSYEFEAGHVVYSSIPLDFYLSGSGTQPNFRNIYAPNVVEYGAELYLAPLELLGTNRKDDLVGTRRPDKINGLNGKDILTGLRGDDLLYGGNGSDTLIGVDPNSATPGRWEVDVLNGGNGPDTFVLGDAKSIYYNDGNLASEGLSDYALITDNANEDTIQLKGTAADYKLVQGITVNDSIGTGIFLNDGQSVNELIGLVEGVTGLDLNSNDFSFV